jgi:hypothetical protein
MAGTQNSSSSTVSLSALRERPGGMGGCEALCPFVPRRIPCPQAIQAGPVKFAVLKAYRCICISCSMGIM